MKRHIYELVQLELEYFLPSFFLRINGRYLQRIGRGGRGQLHISCELVQIKSQASLTIIKNIMLRSTNVTNGVFTDGCFPPYNEGISKYTWEDR